MMKQRVSKWAKYVYDSELALSVLMHALLLCGLVLSVSFSSSSSLDLDMTPLTDQMSVINATFIDPAVTQAKFDQANAQKQAKAQAKAQAQAEARRKQREQKAKRDKAAAQKKAAKAKQDAQQKQQRELERQAQAAIAKKKAAEQAREAAKLAEAKKQADAAALKAQQEQALADQLAEEQAQIRAKQQQQVMSETQRYSVLIKSTIQRNLITNEAFKGKKCQLNIRLGIGGVVLRVDKVAGDEALCRAAMSAVYKPSNLPVSRDPEVFAQLRDINLTVEQ